jgi:hypothetical protein
VKGELVTARVTPTEEGRRQIAATEGAIMADQLWIVFVDGVAQTGVLPYARSEDVALRLWREQTGPGELARERLCAVPKASAVTTGYRCWVRTSIKPQDTRVWVATRRLDAVAQVKAAVRNNKSEGGVESHDPDKPYDVTFAMVRGKLTETKHTD